MSNCIYKYTNIINGKEYVGISNNMKARNNAHKRAKIKENPKFHNAVRRYGFENFILKVLEDDILSRELLCKKEVEYINKFDTYHNGYNCTIGGEGTTGLHGEDTPGSKLTEDSAKSIIDDIRCHAVVATEYNVSPSTINDIRRGKSWKHLYRNSNIVYEDGRIKVTEETAKLIINDYRSNTKIAKSLNMKAADIRNIRSSKHWSYLITTTIIYDNDLVKLTDDKALEIINDSCSISLASKKYSISKTVIYNIRKGNAWKHLDRSNAPIYKGTRK